MMFLRIKRLFNLITFTRSEPQNASDGDKRFVNIDIDLARTYGDAARDRKEWADAVIFYQKYLRQRRRDAAIWIQLGHALKESGRIQEARRAYEEAATLEPSSADVHLQLGHTLKLQGLRAAALRSYSAAKELDDISGHAAIEIQALSDFSPAESHNGSTPKNTLAPTSSPLLLDEDSGGLVRDQIELLSKYDLSYDFISAFDFDFYALSNRLARSDLANELLNTLRHFCEVGFPACRPIAESLHFDPIFYAEFHGKFPMSDTDAYRKWLNQGLAAGEAPNLALWLRNTQGLDIESLDGIDFNLYRELNANLSSMSKGELIQHFFDHGIVHEQNRIIPTLNNVSVFAAVARRASMRRDTEFSLAIYSLIPVEWLLVTNNLNDYADRLFDANQHSVAKLMYEKIIEAGQANNWTYILLARCCKTLGLYEQALKAIRAGQSAFPEQTTLREQVSQIVNELFDYGTRSYHAFASLGHIAHGQKVLSNCLASIVQQAEKPVDVVNREIRSVAIYYDTTLRQCRFYRVEQKIEHLQAASVNVEAFDGESTLSELSQRLNEFQAVIFYRVAAFPKVMSAIRNAQEYGLVTIYEVDDLIFDANEYPGPLDNYAGQLTSKDYAQLALGVPLFIQAMKLCDYALASTMTLADQMQPLVRLKKAFVHRNGLGSDHEHYMNLALPSREAGPVTIFYGSGTLANKKDFQELVEPALIRLAKKHGEGIEFIMVGWLPLSQELTSGKSKIVVMNPVFDIHLFWSIMRSVDINISVLHRSLNTDAKSEIKWLEASMFGIPSVVSRTATYEEVIKEGETGFLCDTSEQWFQVLDRLIDDPLLRLRIGENARRSARRDYSAESLASNLASILKKMGAPPVRLRRKIAFVNVFYPPQTFGGATRVLNDNINRISSHYGNEFEPYVFTTVDEGRDDYVIDHYAHDGIPVTRISRSSSGDVENKAHDERMYDMFAKFLRDIKPDIVHFHCIQRLTVAVVKATLDAGIPYVITAHDAWWISDSLFMLDENDHPSLYDYNSPILTLSTLGQKSWMRLQALRAPLFGAYKILPVSIKFGSLYQACHVPNVMPIPNGLGRLDVYPRVPSTDHRVRLGHVGHIARHKGYHLMKYALLGQEFENLSVIAIDQTKPESYRHCEVWGTTPVSIIGRRSPGRMGEVYAEIDVLLAPSIVPESFGLATREAMACGCWIIASDRGDIGTDVIENVNGHVIDVSDTTALSVVLARIDADKERYRQAPQPMQNARSSDDQVAELVALYREICEIPRQNVQASCT